jgi:hypothetical protein
MKNCTNLFVTGAILKESLIKCRRMCTGGKLPEISINCSEKNGIYLKIDIILKKWAIAYILDAGRGPSLRLPKRISTIQKN